MAYEELHEQFRLKMKIKKQKQKQKNRNLWTLITHKMLSIVTSIAFVALKYCWAAYLQQYARFAIIC